MEETMKISLKKTSLSNTSKQKQNVPIPDDYIEVIPKYISIYQGCWLKYSDKDTMTSYAGGYFINYEDNMVILRNIRKDIFELRVDRHYFYCKNDTPHHEAVREIIKEKDKFSIRLQQFNIEKQKFIEKQKKIFN
jgi:hypothetical protein